MIGSPKESDAALGPERVRGARLGDALVFFLTGVATANWSARIPAVKEELGISDGQLALAFVGLNAGAVIGLQLGGVLAPRLGSRRTLRAVFPIFALLLVGPGVAGSLGALILSLFAYACANSIVDVGMNAHGVAVQSRYGRPIMSSLHAMLSVGLVAGSALGALAAHLDISPGIHFAAVGAALAVVGLVASRLLLPSEIDASCAARLSASDLVHGWTRPLLVLGLLAFCCTIADGAALEWTTVYLRDTLGVEPAVAALGFTVFASAQTLGRLTGDRLTTRFGPVRLFGWGVVVAGAGFGGALLMDSPVAGFIGVGLLGAGLSYALPLTIGAGGNLRGHSAAVAAARVSTLAYLGSFTGPAVIGFFADRIGLAGALGIPAVVVTVTVLGARAVAPATAIREPAESQS